MELFNLSLQYFQHPLFILRLNIGNMPETFKRTNVGKYQTSLRAHIFIKDLASPYYRKTLPISRFSFAYVHIGVENAVIQQVCANKIQSVEKYIVAHVK